MNKKVSSPGGLNIRSGPGTTFDILGTADDQQVITVIETTGWTPIVMEDDSVGWVSSKYLVEAPVVVEDTVKPGIKATGKQVVLKAMTQAGDPYIFGYEVDLDDPNPKAFDCSELVQWTCHQLAITPEMPDGAANQCDHCRKYKTLITVAEAVKTVGALLFRIPGNGENHVVISRGDGSTIEAKGSAYGVGVFTTAGRGWTHAAKIPGVVY